MKNLYAADKCEQAMRHLFAQVVFSWAILFAPGQIPKNISRFQDFILGITRQVTKIALRALSWCWSKTHSSWRYDGWAVSWRGHLVLSMVALHKTFYNVLRLHWPTDMWRSVRMLPSGSAKNLKHCWLGDLSNRRGILFCFPYLCSRNAKSGGCSLAKTFLIK